MKIMNTNEKLQVWLDVLTLKNRLDILNYFTRTKEKEKENIKYPTQCPTSQTILKYNLEPTSRPFNSTMKILQPKQVKVRGQWIPFDLAALNSFLETLVVIEKGESLPAYARFVLLRLNQQELATCLCIPGKGFE